MFGLTGRQAAIIAFIERAVARQGYPPSMREIGTAVKLASTSSVSHHLMALERKGYFAGPGKRPRHTTVRSKINRIDLSPVRLEEALNQRRVVAVPVGFQGFQLRQLGLEPARRLDRSPGVL
ncbi:hypothetical protein [Streptomyces sp. NPDC013457]|uniref:LexA family protein n=1 Tax=Streptomyces sp. NPDC013457 TaxID=3364866 RepID=UPI0036F5B633